MAEHTNKNEREENCKSSHYRATYYSFVVLPAATKIALHRYTDTCRIKLNYAGNASKSEMQENLTGSRMRSDTA
jgi:hypothetical protein